MAEMVAYKVMARPTIPNSFCALGFLLASLAAHSADDSFKAPDHLVLKNGKTVNGLILKNSRDAVLFQEKFEEVTYPKSGIVRIIDHADDDIHYTDIARRGELPSWRVIANDLRTNDAIESLVEIPATVIDNGEFKNVPYKSFRVNNDIELNIYGDPEDPAGLELGIYGSRSGSEKLRHTLRSYLAGFLTTRDEIAKLYALSFKGGIATSGSLTLEITPKDAPDAYGAWWVSLYDKKALAEARLSDAEYARLAKPVDQVMDKNGRVIDNGWTHDQMDLSRHIAAGAKVLLRGFYRDKDGVFRVIADPVPKAGN